MFGRAKARRDRRSRDALPTGSNDGMSFRAHSEPTEPIPESSRSPKKRRAGKRRRRRLAGVLMLAGVVLVSYAAATVFWRDPVTDLYYRWQQQRLDGALAASVADFQEAEAELASQRAGAVEAVDKAARQQQLLAAARRFDRRLKLGQPLGRLIVPRLNLNKVFVHGTRWAEDLSRGPGHFRETGIPAIGDTVAIAGHRTTFGAPFRYINKMRQGDEITLQLPYGTFHYSVIKHKIVDNSDWSIIKSLGFDAVVLSACHPLYSAEKRWVVFARLSWVKTMDGGRLTLWQPREAAASSA
jgi:sortase A